MNKAEVIRLLGWATANFPSMQEKYMGPTAALWEKMLSDIPYELAEKALLKVLSTAKFFPTIAEIREACMEIMNPSQPTALEAWGEVVQAIRNYGYYQEEKALASLSPMTAQVVKCIGWRDICTSEGPEIIRAQFRKAYEQQVNKQKELAVLPAEVRQLLTGSTRLLKEVN